MALVRTPAACTLWVTAACLRLARVCTVVCLQRGVNLTWGPVHCLDFWTNGRYLHLSLRFWFAFDFLTGTMNMCIFGGCFATRLGPLLSCQQCVMPLFVQRATRPWHPVSHGVGNPPQRNQDLALSDVMSALQSMPAVGCLEQCGYLEGLREHCVGGFSATRWASSAAFSFTGVDICLRWLYNPAHRRLLSIVVGTISNILLLVGPL